MGFVAWIVVGLLVVSILLYVVSQRTRQMLPEIELPPGEKLPKTALQRYAARVILLVGSLTVLAAAVVIYHGPQVWWDNDRVRLTVTFVLLAALVAYLLFTLAVRALEKRDDGSFDERDGLIMSRASAGVGGAMMTVMAIWMIALVEAHQETHLLPSYYLYLVFWSMVMTNVIASLAGILLACRRG